MKVLVNRGLLYLQLKDYGNALLDLVDAGKVMSQMAPTIDKTIFPSARPPL